VPWLRPRREPEWERWAGVSAAFCIAMIALMLAPPSFSNAAKPRHGIRDPVLALQMAHNLDDVDAILGDAPSPDREVMRIKQYEDFGFIAGYAALYVLLGALLWRTHKILAIAAAGLGIAAAILDVAENFAILRLCDVSLAQTTQALIDAVHRRALAKWACGFLSLGLFPIYFFEGRRKLARAAGSFYLAASIAGLAGLYENSILFVAPLLILAALLLTTVSFLFLRPSRLNVPGPRKPSGGR